MKDLFDLNETYVKLDGSRAKPIHGEYFWQLPAKEKNRLAGGWLVAGFPIHQDTHWERHPEGDEVLYMISGSVQLIQEAKGGERVIEMQAGDTPLQREGQP